MNEAIKKLPDEMSNEPVPYCLWKKLTIVTLAEIIVFNKRGGEVGRMLVQSFLKKPDWLCHSNNEILCSF